MLVDTHCHLNNPRLLKDIDRLYKNALNKGVGALIVIGYDYKSSLEAIRLAKEYPAIYAVVGIHPNEIADANEDDFEKIEALLKEDKVVALGEIGLDYHWKRTPVDMQHYYFEYFIKMAHRNNMPIVIHNRNSDADLLKILQKNKEYVTKGVMHCYSSSVEMVKDFLDLNLHISFAGPLTFLNAKRPKEAVKAVPLDRLLVETDAPYLTPHPFRGKPNEPAYVRYVAEEMARVLNMSFEDVAKLTTKNAKELFNLDI